MNFNNGGFLQDDGAFTRELSRDFFKKVYAYMALALIFSGGVAYYIGSSIDVFANLFINKTTGGVNALFYVVTFAPVGLVFLIQMAYRKLSMPLLTILFLVFASLMGASLSSIFFVYSMNSIAVAFFVSAGAFAGMAFLGYTTKTDLTKFGSLLYMVFIGIFIASIVNIFVKSDGLSWIVSFLGIFVFTGLTAYWMQQLKGVSKNNMLTGVERDKLALIGALNLYVLFINLFLSLLEIFGRRN